MVLYSKRLMTYHYNNIFNWFITLWTNLNLCWTDRLTNKPAHRHPDRPTDMLTYKHVQVKCACQIKDYWDVPGSLATDYLTLWRSNTQYQGGMKYFAFCQRAVFINYGQDNLNQLQCWSDLLIRLLPTMVISWLPHVIKSQTLLYVNLKPSRIYSHMQVLP